MPFGAEASPFILGATLRYHIDQQPEDFAETVAVEELRTNTYVDNLMKTGGQVEEMRKFKEETTHILEDAKFKVHKWESNIEELEDQNMPNPSKRLSLLIPSKAALTAALIPSPTLNPPFNLGVIGTRTPTRTCLGKAASQHQITKITKTSFILQISLKFKTIALMSIEVVLDR